MQKKTAKPKNSKQKPPIKFERVGKTTLAPEVLVTVARMSALEVKGVAKFASARGSVSRLFNRGAEEGIEIKVEDGIVYIEMNLILKNNVNVRDVSRNVQLQVARAVSEMVNLEVGHVNIHVADIDYGTESRR